MRKMPIIRQMLLALLATGMLAGGIIYPHTAAAVGLKEDSVVTGNTITLGDIFTGLPRDADKVMGISPQPGREMVLDARTLLRIAIALDLPWRPETSADTVIVKRAATIVDRDMIDEALHASLADKGITGEYKLVMAEDPQNMILPQDMTPGVEVSSLNIKQGSDWFEATLAAPSKDQPLTTRRISGRIERMAKIPVLRENLNNGTVIGVNDIDYITIPQRNLKSDIVLRAEDLTGRTPRRLLTAGVALNANDLEAPRLVARGEIITMVFNQDGLQLTAQGKALEHGAKGDRIRVVNTSSNKTIVAEVTNDKEVTLAGF
jgi:flagellar basal body P-ring formation protein FlgA